MAGAVPCECIREEVERRRKAALLELCQFPKESEHMTFENFKVHPGTEEAYQAAVDMAEGTFPELFLTFSGDSDRGKTHLLIAICRRWIQRDNPACYIYVPRLLDDLKTGFGEKGDESYLSRFNFFCTVPLLGLDDLGVENKTPWVRERMDMLFDQRLMAGLRTVVSTNTPFDLMSFRIASRLQRRGYAVVINSREYSALKAIS